MAQDIFKYIIKIFLSLLPVSVIGQPLKISTGAQGIETLNYGGVDLINSSINKGSALTTEGFIYIDKKKELKSGWSQQISNTFDNNTGFFKGVFNWGSLNYKYEARGDTLKVTLKITNTSRTDTLCGVNVYPMHLSFPQRPVGFQPLQFYYHYNTDAPSIIPVNYGSSKMLLCNDNVKDPLFVGMLDKNEGAGGEYKIWVSTIGFNGLSELAPVIYKKLAPGKSVTYNISLRFCPPAENEWLLAEDILVKYRKAWPQQMVWKDKRPIGYLMLSSVENKDNTNNPRGWFPNSPVNINTAEGRKDFNKRVLQYAEQSIAILKNMNAQGMITWDIEGQEFPHPLSYVGDPEKMQQLAPEMKGIADSYFKKFRDAGLKVGVCLRPDSVALSRDKKQLRRIAKDQLNQLARKIRYTRKVWGCTMFYIDSNGDPNYPHSADVFRRLNRLFPDVLLIPEHQNTRYYSCSAPYEEMRGSIEALPEITRLTYPDGFMVLNVTESLQQGTELFSQKLKTAVRQGNILLFRAWYNDSPTNELVNEAYK